MVGLQLQLEKHAKLLQQFGLSDGKLRVGKRAALVRSGAVGRLVTGGCDALHLPRRATDEHARRPTEQALSSVGLDRARQQQAGARATSVMSEVRGQIATCVATMVSANPAERVATALELLFKLLTNVATDSSKDLVKASNRAIQSKLLDCAGGADALHTAGFRADSEPVATAQSFRWDPSLDAEAAVEAVRTAQGWFAAIRGALVVVGDANAPAAAQDAVKMATTYVGNLAAEGDEKKRRIGAANKALLTRLLGAKGGLALLLASGFAAEPADAEPEAYVCTATLAVVRLAHATLLRAPQIWADVAAERGAEGGGGAAPDGKPRLAPPAEPSVAVDGIQIASLPPPTSLVCDPTLPDMQPALVRSGGAAEVHCWQAASRRWAAVGKMEVPSTTFVWARRGDDGRPGVPIDVDLGDGKPVELWVAVEDGDVAENEYGAAQRFITYQ